MARHIIRPLRFMLPPLPGLRSPLLLRFGLFLYDVLGARKLLPASQTVDLTHHVVGNPLKREFQYGFEYSDCRVDDSRLVVLNALDAAEHGAVLHQLQLRHGGGAGGGWSAPQRDGETLGFGDACPTMIRSASTFIRKPFLGLSG